MRTQFVIYGQSRSGSTLLVNLMNNSSSIHCDGELFSRDYVASQDFPRLYNSFPLPFIYRMRGRSRLPVYGFKLLFYQIRYTRYWMRFLSTTGWRVIHLRRRNIVDQAFSSLIAHLSGHFHRRGDEVNPTDQIVIRLEQLERELHKREQWTAQELDFIGDVPRMTLTYEDDLLDESVWPATIDRLAAYLGTPSFAVDSAGLRKTDERPLSMVVSNYAELHAHLAKGDYARFLSA